MWRRTRVALVAATAVACSNVAAGEDLVQLAPLHVIPTENQTTEPLADNGPARVRLSSHDPQALAAVLGISVPAGQASFVYVIDAYPQLRGSATRTWLEPTFVIDFTEPEFEPLRRELDARETRITPPQLVEYVADLVEATNGRDWDFASAVARQRKGDCSEHAVLTAALARLQGIPSRVVIGVALVSAQQNHAAFGHAWAEMLEDGKWKVADAALFGVAGTVRYVPIGIMEDESMGYMMELMRLMQMWIDRVVVLDLEVESARGSQVHDREPRP